MKLEFKKVIIHHFLSFGDAEIDLKDNGYVLVSGINNNPSDSAISNGSGKSTIWSAICFALTGETIQGLTKNLSNIYFDDGCWVELQFNVDEDEYRIIRYKDDAVKGSDLKIYINGVDKSGKGIRETQGLLNQYLPDLTSELIGSVIILGQGLPHKFSNNTPAGRKEVLEKLSKSDFMIEDIKTRLSNREQKLKTELRALEDSKLSLSTQFKLYQNDKESASNELKALEESAMTDESYNSMINDLVKQLEDKTAEFDIVNQEGIKINEQIELINSKNITLLEQKNKIVSEINFEYHQSSSHINSDISMCKMKINAIKNEIQKLESIKDVCPTCGQKIPGTVKPDTSELHNQLIDSNKELEELTNKSNLLSEEYNKKLEEAPKSLNEEYKNNCAEIYTLKSKIDSSKSSRLLAESTSLRNRINTLEVNRAGYSIKVEALKQKINDLTIKMETTEKDIIKVSSELEELSKHFDVITKMNTLIKRDFRGFLLKSVIDFINKKAKEYCSYVFDTNAIEFTLNGNNIDISYCNKQYENLSGGEKQKVDLIIQFSIRDMMCQYLNFSSNILVLDEIFDNLDAIGCTKVLNLISEKLTDIESIFIITHHSTDLAIPSDSELVVVKDSNGVSEVRR